MGAGVMAGYSGTPLAQKLGLKPGQRLVFRAVPPAVLREIGALPDGAKVTRSVTGVDFVLHCSIEAKELRRALPKEASHLAPAGMLWIGWPKKASKVETNLTENVVREIGLAAGLVDVKVCAIDETWSGLKFVRRLKDR